MPPSPSFWDKWAPRPRCRWDDDAPEVSDAPSIVDDDAMQRGNATHRMSFKKTSLLALSIAAITVGGGAFFVLNGTRKDTTEAIDASKIESMADRDDCGDIRRVLVVPGIEEFESPKKSSDEVRKMRTLKLKGGSRQNKVRQKKKCVKTEVSDKCAPKTKTKKITAREADRKKVGQPSAAITARSPGPTLCRDGTEEETLPDPRGDDLPVTEPPTPTPRRTSSPTKAVFTPGEGEVPITSVPSGQPTKATPRPTRATPVPTSTAEPSLRPTQMATPSPSASPSSEDEVYDAVIIGAGWSGIRAALFLRRSGYKNILVLEANNYVGGRSKSVTTTKVKRDDVPIPVDIGSEWIYPGTSLYEKLESEGLIDETIEQNELYTEMGQSPARVYVQQVNNDGTVSAEELNENDLDTVWGRFATFRKQFLESQGDLGYTAALEQFLETNDVDDDDEQYLRLILENNEANYAGDSNVLSLYKSNMYMEVEGAETNYMLGRFGVSAEAVAIGLQDVMQLNSVVTKIDYQGDGVLVSYDKNGVPTQVTARSALVTVSLGVLKAKSIHFSPSLPQRKERAIEDCGFGLLNKVSMFWENTEDIAWSVDTFWFNLVTPEDSTSGEWTTYFNPTSLTGTPSLIGWIAGTEAEAAGDQTDEEIMQHVFANLKSMFPTIRYPTEFFISRWQDEKNFRGSYSFEVAGGACSRSALRERVGDVWFAGEATNSDWYATTVGAWDAGKVAAKDMVEFLDSL